MVGVIVCEQHRVDDANAGAEQLQAQLGWCVDEQVAPGEMKQHGAAITMVARVGALADGTPTADHRYTDRSAGAQKREGPRGHGAPESGRSRWAIIAGLAGRTKPDAPRG